MFFLRGDLTATSSVIVWLPVSLTDIACFGVTTHTTLQANRCSVFLRCVEYYRGVLFLTTNRVGQFDEAFISRIHCTIPYAKLERPERNRIWDQFFEKLEEDRDDFIINPRARNYVLSEDDSADSNSPMAKMELNGREIRNGECRLSSALRPATNCISVILFPQLAFQTAVALAEFRHKQNLETNPKKNTGKNPPAGPVLDKKDFEQVCKMMGDFKDYLERLHGANEEERAFQLKARVPSSL